LLVQNRASIAASLAKYSLLLVRLCFVSFYVIASNQAIVVEVANTALCSLVWFDIAVLTKSVIADLPCYYATWLKLCFCAMSLLLALGTSS